MNYQNLFCNFIRLSWSSTGPYQSGLYVGHNVKSVPAGHVMKAEDTNFKLWPVYDSAFFLTLSRCCIMCRAVMSSWV